MKKLNIDGYFFEGPYILDKDELPESAGIALMCTEAGEGIKIMSVEVSDNLAEEINNCDRKHLWIEKARKGQVDIYINLMDDIKRESIADSIAEKRASVLTCQKPKIIEDDW